MPRATPPGAFSLAEAGTWDGWGPRWCRRPPGVHVRHVALCAGGSGWGHSPQDRKGEHTDQPSARHGVEAGPQESGHGREDTRTTHGAVLAERSPVPGERHPHALSFPPACHPGPGGTELLPGNVSPPHSGLFVPLMTNTGDNDKTPRGAIPTWTRVSPARWGLEGGRAAWGEGLRAPYNPAPSKGDRP